MPPAIMAYSIGADIKWNVLGAAVVLITASAHPVRAHHAAAADQRLSQAW